jgi:hypothetical protein
MFYEGNVGHRVEMYYYYYPEGLGCWTYRQRKAMKIRTREERILGSAGRNYALISDYRSSAYEVADLFLNYNAYTYRLKPTALLLHLFEFSTFYNKLRLPSSSLSK